MLPALTALLFPKLCWHIVRVPILDINGPTNLQSTVCAPTPARFPGQRAGRAGGLDPPPPPPHFTLATYRSLCYGVHKVLPATTIADTDEQVRRGGFSDPPPLDLTLGCPSRPSSSEFVFQFLPSAIIRIPGLNHHPSV